MCTSNANVISKITDPVVGINIVTGDDTMTNNDIVIQFHGAGTPTCVGNEVVQTRYFHFENAEFAQMTAAIALGKDIQIRARELVQDQFTRVKWEAV